MDLTDILKVVMAMFGISHTINTRVGNDFVRGVSGGERKRVTIAEATLSFAPLQCWDNCERQKLDLKARCTDKSQRLVVWIQQMLWNSARLSVRSAMFLELRLWSPFTKLHKLRMMCSTRSWSSTKVDTPDSG
jgi:hypothetical protein